MCNDDGTTVLEVIKFTSISNPTLRATKELFSFRSNKIYKYLKRFNVQRRRDDSFRSNKIYKYLKPQIIKYKEEISLFIEIFPVVTDTKSIL